MLPLSHSSRSSLWDECMAEEPIKPKGYNHKSISNVSSPNKHRHQCYKTTKF